LKRAIYILVILLAAALKTLAQNTEGGGYSNIEFVENKGQWDSRVRFKGEINIGAVYLEKTGFSVLLYDPTDLARLTDSHHGITTPQKGGAPSKGVKTVTALSASPQSPGKSDGTGGQGPGGSSPPTSPGGSLPGGSAPSAPGGGGPSDMMLRSHAYRVTFAGASDNLTIVPDKVLPGYNNYFIGNDSSKWGSNCKVYQGVTYRNVYPNIDIRFYTYNGQLKYDIIVHPGGDISQVRMIYDGADKLSIKKGQLITSTSVGPVTQPAPYSYLFDPQHGRSDINCKYVIRDGKTLSFQVPEHDAGATLIIDPTVVFCSFTGSKVSNWGFTATPGPGGTFFAGGIVFGSAFPYTTGQLQPVYGLGQFDVGIIKLSSNGSSKLYATYLGGTDSETPHSMFSDPQGNLVVLGRTYSANFPFKSVAGGGGAADMFVAMINPAGSALVGCMRIGGSGNDCVNTADQVRSQNERATGLIRNYGDDSRSEVIVDNAGNILVAASTQSGGTFPIVGNVFQPNFGGGLQDGIVLKIDPSCNHLVWSSYLGGSNDDAAFVLKVSPISGDIYVGGATNSNNLPGDHGGVVQPGFTGGTSDGFVADISADGATLKKTTYLGTDAAESIYGLQFDREGFPYVMGTTNGTWQIINAPYSVKGARQFVSKLKPDLSAYVFSTTFGTSSSASHGNPNISPVAFLVDRCENMYVSGWGGWIIGGETDPYGLLGTIGMYASPDASKKISDNRDFYFIVLQKNAAAPLYGTFFGQSDNSKSISEHVDGGTSRYDAQGVIYQGICANCNGGATGRFPTTTGVWSPTNGAGANGCNEAALKISFNYAGVAAGLRASVNGKPNDTSGCIPMDTDLQDTIRNAKQYIWNFGDGSPDTTTTTYDVQHTYVNPGTYTVMMIAIDSSSCNVADTAYRHVIARTDKAPVDFTFLKDPNVPCTSLTYDFTNTSVAPPGKPFGPVSFIWDYGDGSPQITTPFGPTEYSFKAPGTYNVSLILNDTAYCNYPDSAVHTLRVSPVAKAQFITPAAGCAPYNAYFNNTSLGGLQFTWDFGDGQTSNEVNPTHLYASPGTYQVTLLDVDPTTCNLQDLSQPYTITVSQRPTAGFAYQPSPPVPNTPVIFSNESVGGVSYKWDFGDGDTTVTTSMDTVMHQYIETDSFNVCLVTTNQYGCSDTVCHPVAALINPLLDVPNAFTPGRFGQNAIVKVVGFGITHMDFRIYNRWGKMVFFSDNPDVGWDGIFQGTMQPMDVYAYTLEADFSNGKHVTKKGDITLVR
jgi:gliding motility-associated-like protein